MRTSLLPVRAPLPCFARFARLVCLVCIAGVLACSKPAPPTLVPVSATVTQLGPQGIDLTLAVNATNPNGVDLTSQGLNAHVVLNKTIDLGNATYAQGVSLPAGKTTLITVPLSIPWNSVVALVQLGASSGPVPYTVDGTVTMGGTLLDVPLPFHLDGTVTHEQVVSATMRSLPAVPGLALPR